MKLDNVFKKTRLSSARKAYISLGGTRPEVPEGLLRKCNKCGGAIIAEVSCPTRYFPEASSINFRRSAVYGLGCLHAGLRYRLARWHLLPWKKLPPERRGLMKGSRNGETP